MGQGQLGAGPEGKSWKDIDKDHLHFVLHGERMQGEWLLIRLKPRSPKEKRENWLLRKLQDEYAQEGDALVEHCAHQRADRSLHGRDRRR